MDSKYGELHQLFDANFMEYTSYVIKERAIPDVADGLKPVQRRILTTLHNMDDGRFHKVANVVGETMKLHPHGDASIYSALVNLANKEYLIERQGNFGNIYTGDQASAPRYIECRLTPLARETLFNRDLTEYTESYDGRMQEPLALPAKLPLLLLLGAEGIAVGMATKILPHNFCELLGAQKKILLGEPYEIYPDFAQGGFVDVTGYEKGNGKIKCRARIEEKDDKTITIKEIPYGTTTQSLIESIEKAARSGKIKIYSIDDYTAESVEIEIKLARGIYAAETIQALFAFSDCEVSISPNLMTIRNSQPVNMSVDEVLQFNTEKLLQDLEKELSIDLGRQRDRLHAHLLEQIFIEERIYKQIEECTTYEAVTDTILEALLPYRDRLDRDVTREDVERLLEIKIKRISRYDINKKSKEIKEVRDRIKEIEKHLTGMVKFTIDYLDSLLSRYGKNYPRKTQITTFDEIAAREVALSNLSVAYDPESGFLGHQVKTSAGVTFACSEYDRILLIYKNGLYKVINVIDKLFVGHDIEWVGKWKDGVVFNVIYRSGEENLCYFKRFRSPKFILDKEYRLFSEHRRSEILYLSLGEGGAVRVHFAPSKRARSNYADMNLSDFLIKGVSAIGKRISPRSVRRIVERSASDTAAGQEEVQQPTLFSAGSAASPPEDQEADVTSRKPS